jgi:hypothetical protein
MQSGKPSAQPHVFSPGNLIVAEVKTSMVKNQWHCIGLFSSVLLLSDDKGVHPLDLSHYLFKDSDFHSHGTQ